MADRLSVFKRIHSGISALPNGRQIYRPGFDISQREDGTRQAQHLEEDKIRVIRDETLTP